jgi:hypothetical protein
MQCQSLGRVREENEEMKKGWTKMKEKNMPVCL